MEVNPFSRCETAGVSDPPEFCMKPVLFCLSRLLGDSGIFFSSPFLRLYFYTISTVPFRNLVATDNSHFKLLVLHFKHLKTERELTMTHNARTYAYRYFSFTYQFGKAYFGLA